jgi:Tfp pilus assembly protein PilO
MRIGRVRVARIGALLALLVLAAIAWFLVLSPRLSSASELAADAEQLQVANLSLLNTYNRALDQAEAAPAAAATAQALFERMPQTAELPAVLDQITAAATDAGISPNAISTLTTSVPVAVAAGGATGIQLASMEIGVNAEGTRAEVLAFLDNLQALDRALLVTSNQVAAVVEAEGGRGPVRETVQVGGSMFVLESALPDLVAAVEELITQAEQATGATTATDDATAEDAPAG